MKERSTMPMKEIFLCLMIMFQLFSAVWAVCSAEKCLSDYIEYFRGNVMYLPESHCFIDSVECLLLMEENVVEFSTEVAIDPLMSGDSSCRLVTFGKLDAEEDPRATFNINTFLPITGHEKIRGRPERLGLVLALLHARSDPRIPEGSTYNATNCISINPNLDSGEGLEGSTSSVRNGAVYVMTDQAPRHILYGPNNSNYTITTNNYFLTPFRLNQITPFASDTRLSQNAPGETFGYLSRTVSSFEKYSSTIHVLARIIYEKGWKNVLVITDLSYDNNIADSKLFTSEMERYGIDVLEISVTSKTEGAGRNSMIEEAIQEIEISRRKVMVLFCSEKVIYFVLLVSQQRNAIGPGVSIFGVDNWSRSKIEMLDIDRWGYTDVLPFYGAIAVYPKLLTGHDYYKKYLSLYAQVYCKYEDWYNIERTKEHLGVFGVPYPSNKHCLKSADDVEDIGEDEATLEALRESRALIYSYEVVRLIEKTIHKLRMEPKQFVCGYFSAIENMDQCKERGCFYYNDIDDPAKNVCRPYSSIENRVAYFKYFLSPVEPQPTGSDYTCDPKKSDDCIEDVDGRLFVVFPPGGIRDAMRRSKLVHEETGEVIFQFANPETTENQVKEYTGERLTDFSIVNLQLINNELTKTRWVEIGTFNTTKYFQNLANVNGSTKKLTEGEIREQEEGKHKLKKPKRFVEARPNGKQFYGKSSKKKVIDNVKRTFTQDELTDKIIEDLIVLNEKQLRANSNVINNRAIKSTDAETNEDDYVDKDIFDGVFGDIATSYPFNDDKVVYAGYSPTDQDISCEFHQKVMHLNIGGILREGSTCVPCEAETCSSGGESVTCDPCNNIVRVNFAIRISIMCVGIVFICVSLGMIAYVFLHMAHPLIRASAANFLFVFLGGIISGMASLVIHFFPMNRLTCTLRMWFLFIGLSLVYGSLIIKNYRIAKIFSTKGSAKRIGLKDSKLFIYLGAILLVAATLLAVWSGITSTFLENDVKEQLYYSDITPVCRFHKDIIFYVLVGFLMALVLVGVRISWQIRNTPLAFNEAKWVSFALYDLFVSTIIYLFLSQYVDEPLYLHLISAFYHILVFIGPLVLLFAPKIFSIHFAKDKKDDGATGSSYGRSNTDQLDSDMDTLAEAQSQIDMLKKAQIRLSKSIDTFAETKKLLLEKCSVEVPQDD